MFTNPAGDDGTRARLRAACLHYLSLGGAATAGPVGLLSGLSPSPGALVTHFFAVAAVAAGRCLAPPSIKGAREAYDLLHVACIILLPLLEADGVGATWLAHPLPLGALNLVFPWRGG